MVTDFFLLFLEQKKNHLAKKHLRFSTSGTLAGVKRKDLAQTADKLPEAYRYFFSYHYSDIPC